MSSIFICPIYEILTCTFLKRTFILKVRTIYPSKLNHLQITEEMSVIESIIRYLEVLIFIKYNVIANELFVFNFFHNYENYNSFLT